jgi:predicted Zn-dependent protease
VARNLSSKIKRRLGSKHIRRIRWKHLAMLVGGLLLIAVASPMVWSYYTEVSIRKSALFQAEQAKKLGDVDLALRHLDRYLTTKPEDTQVLEVKARILGELYLSKSRQARVPLGQALEAAKTLDLLFRLDPKGKDRLVTRRNLAEFYILYSDELKIHALNSFDQDIERQQSRYPAAALIAEQLVDEAEKGHYPDPAAHRLLARAYEGQVSDIRRKSTFLKGDSRKTGTELKDKAKEDLEHRTIEHYQIAIELDSHDLESPARLARIYATWTNDQAAADEVLDAMLRANPDSVDARMTRYRAFHFTNRDVLTSEEIAAREKLAQGELEKVLALDPNNVEIRIDIAQSALNRRDSTEARRQLDAIPKERQDDLRVKVMRGSMEFAEEHPDQAIDEWRRGLQIVGGTDQDLTWSLARKLVQLGRYVEAEPLRQQYNRLSKGDRNGLGTFLDAMFDIGYGKLYDARKKLEKIKDTVNGGYRAEVLVLLGRCCDLMGDTDAALLAFKNAASAAPRATLPRMELAHHLQKRHPDEAIAELDRALVEAPKEPSLLLASIQLRLLTMAARGSADPKRIRELEELFTKVEAVTPESSTLIAYRADFLAVSGQLQKAIDSLDKAVHGTARNQPDLWISLAHGLDRMNRRNDALRILDEAALPGNVGDRVKIRIAKARELSRSGKGQAAREVLTRNPEGLSVGERPELAQARAELLKELGDRDGAIAAYAEWAQLAPKVPAPALALLAMAQSENDERAAKPPRPSLA